MPSENTEQTFEYLLQMERPIPIGDLETRVVESPGLDFPVHRSAERNLINDNWNRFVQEMAEVEKSNLFNAICDHDEIRFRKIFSHIAGVNSNYRLGYASLEGNVLILGIGLTDFKEYAGTSVHSIKDPEFRKRLMDAGIADHKDPNHYFANPLATCANIVTSDGMVPIGLRSKEVASYPEMYAIISGFVKVNGKNKPDFSVKDVDLLGNATKELEEEIGVTRDDIDDIHFIGMLRTLATRHPEMMYNVMLNISSAELLDRWKTKSPDKFEHRDITMYAKEIIPSFVEENRERITPTGLAALSAFGRFYCDSGRK